MSTENFKRLWFNDPETTIAEDEFFKLVRKATTDEDLLKQLRQVRIDNVSSSISSLTK